MDGTVFLLDEQEQAVELQEAQYESEDFFQRLLAEHPEIINGVQSPADAPRKWIYVSREVGVPDHSEGGAQWFLDHLLLDQDGVPTLVEVKRGTDTRIRREVVGQMLDYAANACAYWDVSEFRANYEEQCRKQGDDPLAELCPDVEAMDAYWDRVALNLNSKKLRLVFVADRIPDSLRRIIEFLNEQMAATEVLGVEIRQYVSDHHHRILVPQVVGQTAKADLAKGQTDFAWSEESYLKRARAVGGDDAADLCRHLLQAFRDMGCWIYWGKGRKQAGFVPIYEGASRHQLCAVYIYEKRIGIEIYFEHFKAPFDRRERQQDLQAQFNTIPGIHIPDHRLKKRPSFDCKILLAPENLTRFLQIYQAMVDEIKANEAEQQ